MAGARLELATGKTLTDVFLELHVPSFEPVKTFYGRLGFSVLWEKGGDQGYMVIRCGESLLNFYGGTDHVYRQAFFGRYPAKTVRGYGVEIVVPVDDVETCYAGALKSFGPPSKEGPIVEQLSMRPWGKKDFRVIDPFGYYVRLTEPMNWLAP